MEAHLMSSPSVHVESVHDIGTILEQLRTARAASAGNADGAARVATINFVVFVDDPSHREWVLYRAALVAEKHPSRLIVLDSTSATTGVDVSTTMRERGGTTIVNERVDIAVASIDHASIVSLTQELAVPDIPTLLWWSGERLLRSRTFSGLAHTAASVLVDSSGKARGEETIRELGEFLTRFQNVALRDLAFMRLAPWQDMIAQFFDDPALREDLFSLNALEIESGSDAEALYLAGWLGSRLSWEPSERDAFSDRRGTRIPFKKIDKGDQRRVISVVLRSPDSTYRAALSSDDESVVTLSVEGAREKPVRYVPLQNIANTSLIERAILEKARDPIFETSLMTVRDLLG
jgi:glucose-6-phosphate dehydrogenase assembly protein OpcA